MRHFSFGIFVYSSSFSLCIHLLCYICFYESPWSSLEKVLCYFLEHLFHEYIRDIMCVVTEQVDKQTQRCVSVTLRPTAFYETTDFCRRSVIFFLGSFQKWVKFHPSLWLQAVNLPLAPGTT